jgi:hypothetical protein
MKFEIVHFITTALKSIPKSVKLREKFGCEGLYILVLAIRHAKLIPFFRQGVSIF